ncbi:MAG: hypothetical protein US57_C0026G0002 [Candidatus Moranbacteria bacterium GW2011_GWC2_37_73]|nr:MAG: hypothetical protein US57_C0026G0002 [Candidatus Moranbacteria bacterium GW2011_GWC2_37_73]
MIVRLKKVNQLQRLTHPNERGESGYLWFPFPQSRFDHSIFFLAVAKIILSESGFSEQFVQKFLLTLLTHDIATPAGGDATMRLNKQFFCEVKNYRRHMIEAGISMKWRMLYDFDDQEAERWVEGFEFAGFLLNVLDRMSYVALDLYHLGKNKPAKILQLLKKHPLIMDVWRDICVTKECVYFSNAYRLYHFLLLRALMHTEFYLNPNCRKLEHIFFSQIKKLFDSGEISVDDLRYKDDQWLESIVRKGKDQSWCTQPESIDWQCFDNKEDADAFRAGNNSVFHIEHIKPFETGMHWLVMHRGKIMPLCKALPKQFAVRIESLSNIREGWYAYYHK